MEGFKKGPWSKEEDAILLDWVAACGPHSWSCIQSKGLLMRTGKSCRLRWVNKLRPGLKKGRKFSPEEEEMVVKLQAQFGNKWARIAEFFPGRTDNDVKNFWSIRKKRLARSQRGPLPSTGMHVPELVVPPDEVHVYETPTDDQQQDKHITSNYQETMSVPSIHQCLNATSATPVLTRPTSSPRNTKTALTSAPFVEVMQCQQYPNSTIATPVPNLPSGNPPIAKSDPSSVPVDSIMPHQQCLNFTPVTPILTAPTPNTLSIKSGPSSAPFNNMTPQIRSPFLDCLFETESIFFEPDFFFLDCIGTFCAPPFFDDLTDDVLDSFEWSHLPGAKL